VAPLLHNPKFPAHSLRNTWEETLQHIVYRMKYYVRTAYSSLHGQIGHIFSYEITWRELKRNAF